MSFKIYVVSTFVATICACAGDCAEIPELMEIFGNASGKLKHLFTDNGEIESVGKSAINNRKDEDIAEATKGRTLHVVWRFPVPERFIDVPYTQRAKYYQIYVGINMDVSEEVAKKKAIAIFLKEKVAETFLFEAKWGEIGAISFLTHTRPYSLYGIGGWKQKFCYVFAVHVTVRDHKDENYSPTTEAYWKRSVYCKCNNCGGNQMTLLQ